MHQGHLVRAAVELAKDLAYGSNFTPIRSSACGADSIASLIITGNGDVIEPEESLIAIGSGGPFAQAAAKALVENTELSARELVQRALTIAGDICILYEYNLTIEELNDGSK